MMARDLFIGDACSEGFVAYGDNALGGLNSSGAMFVGLVTVDAVPNSFRPFEDFHALLVVFFPGIEDKTVSFGQGGGPEEVEIHRQDRASLIAHATLITAHDFSQILERRVRDDIFSVG